MHEDMNDTTVICSFRGRRQVFNSPHGVFNLNNIDSFELKLS